MTPNTLHERFLPSWAPNKRHPLRSGQQTVRRLHLCLCLQLTSRLRRPRDIGLKVVAVFWLDGAGIVDLVRIQDGGLHQPHHRILLPVVFTPHRDFRLVDSRVLVQIVPELVDAVTGKNAEESSLLVIKFCNRHQYGVENIMRGLQKFGVDDGPDGASRQKLMRSSRRKNA